MSSSNRGPGIQVGRCPSRDLRVDLLAPFGGDRRSNFLSSVKVTLLKQRRLTLQRRAAEDSSCLLAFVLFTFIICHFVDDPQTKTSGCVLLCHSILCLAWGQLCLDNTAAWKRLGHLTQTPAWMWFSSSVNKVPRAKRLSANDKKKKKEEKKWHHMASPRRWVSLW